MPVVKPRTLKDVDMLHNIATHPVNKSKRIETLLGLVINRCTQAYGGQEHSVKAPIVHFRVTQTRGNQRACDGDHCSWDGHNFPFHTPRYIQSM